MRSSAGWPASSSITLPSPAVITISGPIGRAPCDTHARDTSRRRARARPRPRPIAPSCIRSVPPCRRARWRGRRSRAAPGGPSASSASSGSTGNEYGSTSRISASAPSRSGTPATASAPVARLAGLEGERLRRRRSPSDAAHTATPPSSTSRASPTTPCAPQPIAAAGCSRSATAAMPSSACAEVRRAGEHDDQVGRRAAQARARRARRPRRTSRRRASVASIRPAAHFERRRSSELQLLRAPPRRRARGPGPSLLPELAARTSGAFAHAVVVEHARGPRRPPRPGCARAARDLLELLVACTPSRSARRRSARSGSPRCCGRACACRRASGS